MGFRTGEVIADRGRIDFVAFDPVAFGHGGVFESAVLDQLGVEPAVARMVDLLEEDAVQRRRYVRAALRRVDGYPGIRLRTGAQQQGQRRKRKNLA